jgi:hypothetical protein
MTSPAALPPVVCDTDAASFVIKDDPLRGPRYRRHLDGRAVFLPFAGGHPPDPRRLPSDFVGQIALQVPGRQHRAHGLAFQHQGGAAVEKDLGQPFQRVRHAHRAEALAH